MRPAPVPSVLDRALRLLAAFDHDHVVLSLAQLADRAGLPQSTAHRHAAELVSWGALDRAPGGGYQIGLRLVEVAALCPRGPGLREVALPYLEDLYEATHQNVQLAVRDGTEIVYVEFLAARTAVAVRTRVGGRWPMHATGVGLAILAYSPAEIQEQVLSAPLAVFTPRTMRTAGQVRRALAEVRRTGVAISDGQVTQDGYSVAAPVFGRGGVAAAVSVVVPASDARRQSWVPAVRVAAHGISRELAGSHATITVPGQAAVSAPGSSRSS
jgi:DNA-binding IclR family transcriptional regulator